MATVEVRLSVAFHLLKRMIKVYSFPVIESLRTVEKSLQNFRLDLAQWPVLIV